MKRIVLAAILAFCIASTLPAAPTGQSLLVQPRLMAYLFDPIDWMLGYMAGRAVTWVIQNWNNGSVMAQPATQLGSGGPLNNGTPTGGGGGGAW
jgi:hypothetical protein